jgi:hypothetical protein
MIGKMIRGVKAKTGKMNDRKNDPRRQGENRKNGGLLTKIGLNPRSGTNRPNLSVFNILQTGQIDQKKP